MTASDYYREFQRDLIGMWEPDEPDDENEWDAIEEQERREFEENGPA